MKGVFLLNRFTRREKEIMVEITLLYFDGCPSWKMGLENLKSALQSEQLEAKIEMKNIETAELAQKEQFLGSPSFRVNGKDLWPEEREDYKLSCRIYNTPDGMKGFPSVNMLREKLRFAYN